MDRLVLSEGGNNIRLYPHNSNRREAQQGPTVPWRWHGSNSRNRRISGALLQRAEFQWVSTSPTSPALPAGGTTTVDRLPSAVSFAKAARSPCCNSVHRAALSSFCRFSFSNCSCSASVGAESALPTSMARYAHLASSCGGYAKESSLALMARFTSCSRTASSFFSRSSAEISIVFALTFCANPLFSPHIS